MNCGAARDKLGLLLDGELRAEERVAVEEHLRACGRCAAEYDALDALASKLGCEPPAETPDSLWPAIETRLRGGRWRLFGAAGRRRLPYALAAAVALAAGLGLFVSLARESRVEASVLDFRALLEDMQTDARAAFLKFLHQNDAKPITPAQARQSGASLSFDLPEVLPGDFRLQGAYGFRIAGRPGYAAMYDRDGEFLGAIFHPLVNEEDFGSFRDHPCTVGKHRGHKVQVGDWALVHVTGRPRCNCTGECQCSPTCHCVVSRLKEDAELLDVLSAMAPGAASP